MLQGGASATGVCGNWHLWIPRAAWWVHTLHGVQQKSSKAHALLWCERLLFTGTSLPGTSLSILQAPKTHHDTAILLLQWINALKQWSHIAATSSYATRCRIFHMQMRYSTESSSSIWQRAYTMMLNVLCWQTDRCCLQIQTWYLKCLVDVYWINCKEAVLISQERKIWAFLRNAIQCCLQVRWLLQDLCSPDANRLRRNLSAVINFAKFREEKLQPYIEMQEETNELLEETEKLKDQHAVLVSLPDYPFAVNSLSHLFNKFNLTNDGHH